MLSRLWQRAIFLAPIVHIFRLIHRAQAASLSRSLFILRLNSSPLVIILRRNSSSRWLLSTSKWVLIHGATPIYSWWLPFRILLLRLIGVGSLLIRLLLLETLCISLVQSVLILVCLSILWLNSTPYFSGYSVTPKIDFIWNLLHVPSVRAAAPVSLINTCVIHVSFKI